MNEEQWHSCTDPTPMLDFVQSGEWASERRLLLFALECCRRVRHLLDERLNREIVGAVESYADGKLIRRDVVVAWFEMLRPQLHYYTSGSNVIELRLTLAQVMLRQLVTRPLDCRFIAEEAVRIVVRSRNDATSARRAAVGQSLTAARAARSATGKGGDEERGAQASLLRCLFGDMFLPVTFDASWQTPGMLRLARHIYDRRDFAGLPDLAALLEMAGCTDAALLGHFRGDGVHCRGCWGLDLILGAV
jgi:hypothetical protein